MSKGRSRVEPIRAWNQTPRDGSSRLTELRGVREDPTCVWILLDGVKAGMVARETVARAGLVPMTPWTEAAARSVDEEVRCRLCDLTARRLLSVRVRARAELTRLLTSRGHDGTTVAACVDKYAGLGLIDDDRFAEIAVRSELVRRPVGRRLLEAKLRAKGVNDRAARAAIDTAMEGRDEMADALKAAESGARTMSARAEPEAARRRLTARLLRRGFSSEATRRAVDEVLGKPGRAAR
jgi:SOS response regulatory protein OraA/RecX